MEQSGKPGLVGRKLAHYEIRSAIGAGGMGEVFRATDTRLERNIALKVLPANMAADPERFARFQREARAVAALNHPNVVTVFSVENADDVHFITMELIEGHTLDRLITSDGLEPHRIVEISGEIAEALAAAHDKGIVHRDLKPANVMVTNDGRVKVLDFGLAKDVQSSVETDVTRTSPGLTQAGVVMGTPSYMSPEQVSGRPLDHRSDLYSLGVVMFEMATGRRPFDARSSAELISAILRDTPPPVTDIRPELPADLSRVIRRCLEKDPRHRMQTARDINNEFRDLGRAQIGRTNSPRTTPLHTVTTQTPITTPGSGIADSSFWVAVLPFRYGGANAEIAALAEGFSEEIITGLSRFSYLKVISRSSTARYANQAVDVRAAGRELNARYVMEGTLRQAGNKLRLAVQLVDTTTGAHLWAENYERTVNPQAVFELQDDLVPRIVSTVADMNGVLPQSMSEGLLGRAPAQLTPYEAVLRSFAYCYSATPQDLTAARSGVEEATRKAPNYADAWAMLSFLCGQDYVHGYQLQPNALDIAASAARRAVALGPSNHLAYFSLAAVLWYQKDFQSFRDAVERAITLNPMDGNSVAYLGELLVYAGSSDRGMQLAERAKQLNPNHPGWYWFADFYDAFSRSDYPAALNFALKAKMQGNPLAPMFAAAAYGQLGDTDGGAKAIAELLKFRPEMPGIIRKQVEKVWNDEYAEHFLEGLQIAGLDVPPKSAPARTGASSILTKHGSGAARAEEGFWVAVLPFKYSGASEDLKALAEGLTDEIVSGLSRFSYLRVVARGSTARFTGQVVDVRTAGQQLNARYVMEGTLRQAGAKLRLAVQVVDTVTGTHLWAENYERAFSSDAVFELQDDLVPRIVSTVADWYGVLTRSISEALRSKSEDSLTPHEAVLRGFSYFARLTAEEHATVRRLLERVVRENPDHADCWAMLAMMYNVEYSDDYNVLPNTLERSLSAAQRAIELAPSHSMGHYAIAWIYFFLKDKPAFHAALERTIALNPMDGYAIGMLGLLLLHTGERERGMEMTETAIKLNPNSSGALKFTPFTYFYMKGQYKEALDAAVRINMPGFFYAQASLAEVLGQLGDREGAQKAVKELLALRPDFAASARRNYAKWYEPEDVEHFLDGLRKAGLEIPVESRATPGGGSSQISSKTSSGETRMDEGFWIAVLPFRHTGKSEDLAALAEALCDDIITGLNKFSFLRVIARSSTARYANENVDVRAAAKELGARYVLEGSLHHAGAKVRIAARLVDATTGAGLWAETFDRAFTPDALLELLDDVVPRIVSTVGDTQGILVHSMTEMLRHRDPNSLTPYEAVLRSFAYIIRVNEADHRASLAALERVSQDPSASADVWAMLAWLYRGETSYGFNARPNPLGRALDAAQRAIAADPSNMIAHAALAAVHFSRGDLPAFRTAAKRAVSLNRCEGYALAYMGLLLAYSGEWEQGCALAEQATQLNPNHPGWYWAPIALNAYRQRDYKRALEFALHMNTPGIWSIHLIFALIYTQLGDTEKARAALKDLLAIRPAFSDNPRKELQVWFQPEMVERMLADLKPLGIE
jgi:TolB-like protein/Tfp pilus assembly protein PilF